MTAEQELLLTIDRMLGAIKSRTTRPAVRKAAESLRKKIWADNLPAATTPNPKPITR
jgi:hypothetical protein